MAGDQSAELVLIVKSTRYAEDHPAWRDQIAVLHDRLREVGRHVDDDDDDGGTITPTPLRLPGASDDAGSSNSKGVLEIATLMLASAQVIRAAAVVIREWRKQDATRSVSVKVVRPDQSVEVKGTGAAGANAACEAFLAALGSGEVGRPAVEGSTER
jgi:hypothetical protein